MAGLLLAAGGGRRLGGLPKALLYHRGRPLVERAASALFAGGCATVTVVLGAGSGAVRARADLRGCQVVWNAEWQSGMGSSLRAGLSALATGAPPGRMDHPTRGARAPAGAATVPPAAALVLLVDQPAVGAAAVHRLVVAHRAGARLAAATYRGQRGHPVLIGSEHWAAVANSARGDRGARDFLGARAGELTLVECHDVASPRDIDTPEDLGLLD